jgi:hypothetical protein
MKRKGLCGQKDRAIMKKSFEYPIIPPSIHKKIEFTQNLYKNRRNEFLSDPHIHNWLEKLRQKIDITRKALFKSGIFAICKHCEEEGGSCCGAGIENRYDVVLLLINLLLGVSLPEKRFESKSCFFLNENGCTLVARHDLCVNYLCSKIKQTLTLDEIIKVQTLAGDELDTLFIVHEAIKKFINSKNNDQQLFK